MLDAFGLRIGVRSDSPALLRRAAARWTATGARLVTAAEAGAPDVLVAGLLSLHTGARDVTAGARPPMTLYDGAARIVRTADREELLEALDATLRMGIAHASPTHLLVHAGVVGYRGQAIVLPGSSHAGKTTLVRALLARGATYLSDDVAVVDGDGRVLPFARPLAVRDRAHAPQRPVPAESLGARVGAEPLRAGLVAITRWRDGATWRPRAVAGGAAALALIPHVGGMQKRPEHALGLLGRLLDGATVLRGPRGEADACARALLGAVDARTA